MVRELEVTNDAYDDELEIWKYVARDNMPAADRLIEKIEKAYRSLLAFRSRGPSATNSARTSEAIRSGIT